MRQDLPVVSYSVPLSMHGDFDLNTTPDHVPDIQNRKCLPREGKALAMWQLKAEVSDRC